MTDRLTVSPRLQSLMSYRKFAGATPRILFLRSNYWIDGACMNAARTLGWDFEESRVLLEGAMPRELIQQLLEKIAHFRPDMILSVNLSGMDAAGLFAGLFNDLAIPYATWFVDDPRTILMGRTRYGGPYSVAFSWERAYLPYLEACGFCEAHFIPLAVDGTVFNRPPLDSPSAPPTFVGSSMIGYAGREWQWFEGYPEWKVALEAAFDAGRITRANFAGGPAVLLGLDEATVLDAEVSRHVELIAFIEGTRRLREDFVRALAASGPLLLRGDADWAAYGLPTGLPVNYEEELPDLYQNCAVNLNITSIQMPTALNQRNFDCPAAGGFLLTDRQGDLDELFDVDREVACYDDTASAAAMLQYYLREPLLRREIAGRARTRILGEHTYAHRLQALVAVLRARFA
ncbi:MAG: glycosyltransferase [Candidatus Hydrogenedentes bacterium]|nr:glycosyltransferase [Candidatus Hydrogenedentota bacterium]